MRLHLFGKKPPQSAKVISFLRPTVVRKDVMPITPCDSKAIQSTELFAEEKAKLQQFFDVLGNFNQVQPLDPATIELFNKLAYTTQPLEHIIHNEMEVYCAALYNWQQTGGVATPNHAAYPVKPVNLTLYMAGHPDFKLLFPVVLPKQPATGMLVAVDPATGHKVIYTGPWVA